jgi:hypothetical protein
LEALGVPRAAPFAPRAFVDDQTASAELTLEGMQKRVIFEPSCHLRKKHESFDCRQPVALGTAVAFARHLGRG